MRIIIAAFRQISRASADSVSSRSRVLLDELGGADRIDGSRATLDRDFCNRAKRR